MSSDLDRWIHTIDQIEDIVLLSIGMSKNCDMYDTYTTYGRSRDDDGVYTPYSFITDALDVLIKNNFENIDPYSYEIQPFKPIKQKYDDPLQQVFYKNIMIRLRDDIRPYWLFTKTPKTICELLTQIIREGFNVTIPLRPTFAEVVQNTQFENIDQIIEYCESKIPQYPSEITDRLLILLSINGHIPVDDNETPRLENLAKMAELSKYNLRDLPIKAIIYGLSAATPLEEIPLEQIPEYYARLTYSYSGKHTKAARI